MSFPTQEIPTRITLPEDLLAQPGCALTPKLHDCRLSNSDHTRGGYGPRSDLKKENNFQYFEKELPYFWYVTTFGSCVYQFCCFIVFCAVACKSGDADNPFGLILSPICRTRRMTWWWWWYCSALIGLVVASSSSNLLCGLHCAEINVAELYLIGTWIIWSCQSYQYSAQCVYQGQSLPRDLPVLPRHHISRILMRRNKSQMRLTYWCRICLKHIESPQM